MFIEKSKLKDKKGNFIYDDDWFTLEGKKYHIQSIQGRFVFSLVKRDGALLVHSERTPLTKEIAETITITGNSWDNAT